MSVEDPTFAFAVALGAGVAAQALAHHLRIPGIVLFLAAGVVLGPDVLGVVRPDALQGGLQALVSLAVAVILFEGGLNLNIDSLLHQAKTIRRLVTLGATVTAVGGTLAARLLMEWEWSTSILFGTLVIVTGPTVISPLVRRIRLTPRVRTILEAEGVLIDPIGAIIAVVTLEMVLADTAGSAALGLLGIPTRLLVGAMFGVAGGSLMAFLMAREGLVPEDIRNVFTLATLLTLYAVSEAVLPESGILAAPVAGIVVGNARTRLHAELLEFKEQVTVMLVAMLFVLLAADVRVAEVIELGWAGIATIAVLMFVVRPVGVLLCTAGSDLTAKERTFIAWLGPRGIVAAAVASLFAQQLEAEGFGEGSELRALTFLVIAVTVSIQGLSGGPLASLLGLRRRSHTGYAIVGANALGRTLARALADGGQEVVLIDSNPQEALAAEDAGLSVIHGNAHDDHILERADAEGRSGVAMLTGNGDANLLIARHVREVTRIPQRFVCVARSRTGMPVEQIRKRGLAVLFGHPIDIHHWITVAGGDAQIERWRFEGADEAAATEFIRSGGGSADMSLLALGLEQRRGSTPVDDSTVIKSGDVVSLMAAPDASGNVQARLASTGWVPLEATDRAAGQVAERKDA